MPENSLRRGYVEHPVNGHIHHPTPYRLVNTDIFSITARNFQPCKSKGRRPQRSHRRVQESRWSLNSSLLSIKKRKSVFYASHHLVFPLNLGLLIHVLLLYSLTRLSNNHLGRLIVFSCLCVRIRIFFLLYLFFTLGWNLLYEVAWVVGFKRQNQKINI